MTADHGAQGDRRDTGPLRAAYRAAAGLLPPVPRFRVQRTLTLVRRGVRRASGRLAGSRGALIDLPGAGTRRSQPIVLLVALGVDEAGLVARLDEAADVPGRLLVVTDCDAFGVLRERGLVFEYIPSRRDWERHIAGEGYGQFLEARLAQIEQVYRPRAAT